MRTHPPRAFPWEIEPPVGNHHVKAKPRPKARERRPRARPCLNKRCGRKYQPRRWNQRYCQDPECLREVRSWLAARRQAEHRRETVAKAEHAQAERAPPAGQVRAPGRSEPRTCAGAWSRSKSFFPLPECDRPGCYEPSVTSIRNPSHYCCVTCRQAVRNVQDRERKWLSRGTLDGRTKRAYEYRAACVSRTAQPDNTSALAPLRAPPE
jgi:hypothetical protein